MDGRKCQNVRKLSHGASLPNGTGARKGLFLRKNLFAQMPHSALDKVQNMIEPVSPAIIGVRYIALLQKELHLCGRIRRCNGIQIGKIMPVHGEDVGEPAKIIFMDLPRALAG